MENWPINPRRVALFVGALVLILMVMDFNARLEDLNRLKKGVKVVSVQATQAAQTQVALQTQVAYANSDQAVQDWARSEGHYALPGDHPVIPLGQAGATPLQSAEPTATATPLSNWQIWWNLFFGDQ